MVCLYNYYWVVKVIIPQMIDAAKNIDAQAKLLVSRNTRI